MKKDVDKTFIRSFYTDKDRPVLEDSDDELEDADLDRKYGRKLCYGCDDDFRERYSEEKKFYSSPRTSDQAVQTQIDNAMETVRRSKKYLESIDSKDYGVKSAKVIKDATEFGIYLDSLKDQSETYARRHELQKSSPRMKSPVQKVNFYPKNQTLGGPSKFRDLLLPRTGTSASIPVCHSDTFLMTY